jgi:lipopolysaccharide export system permease protein
VPWTLYRYILLELLKLLLATTLVLALLISFAAAIKPITDGLLGPAALAKYLLLTMPTVLGFTVPFAAAFAATLVYLRLASDNELTACRASGLSWIALLAPAAVLGVVLCLGLLWLANFVVPGFYRAAAHTLERDVVSLAVNQLNRGRPFVLDSAEIYADEAVVRPPPPLENSRLAPEQYITLSGVAVAQRDGDDVVVSDATAERAGILLFREPETGEVLLTLVMESAQLFDPRRGEVSTQRLQMGPLGVPTLFRDSPKYFSLPQLRRLAERPQDFDMVRDAMHRLGRRAVAGTLLSRAAGQLGPSDAPTGRSLVLLGDDPEVSYAVWAGGATNEGELLSLAGPVQVTAYRGQTPVRRFEATAATLTASLERVDAEPVLGVELERVRVTDLNGSGAVNQDSLLRLPPLRWPEPVLSVPVGEMDLAQLNTLASQREIASPALERTRQFLGQLLRSLGRDIRAQLHERAASAVAALLLVILGSVLSLHLAGQLPLVVYFWSFLPAIVAILLIHQGESMASDPNAASPLLGLVVLWSGNAMLAAVSGLLFLRLSRT